MHTVIMSPCESDLTKSLSEYGIKALPSQCLHQLRENEQYHADMQVLIINNTAFIPEDCTQIGVELANYGYEIVHCKPLLSDYPWNVSLNVALIGKRLFCKESALDPNVKNYCINNEIEIINVNQGYTKCSTLVLNDKSIITADETIYKAAINNNISVLKISQGYIQLANADYGFIGGCSGVIGDTVYFFGDINYHPDQEIIKNYIYKQGMKIISLADTYLKDIGGFVAIN